MGRYLRPLGRSAAEGLLPDVAAGLGPVGLVVTVGRAVHEVDQRLVDVGGEQRRWSRSRR